MQPKTLGDAKKVSVVKKKKEKIPATLRNVVWCKYFGTEGSGQCYCCGVERISKANFAMGHVESEANGGTLHISNLRPVCTLCNSSMGKTNLYVFKEKYGLEPAQKIKSSCLIV